MDNHQHQAAAKCMGPEFKNYSISIVVPVYNSEAILPLLVQRLEPELDALCWDYETILVNDASRDQKARMHFRMMERPTYTVREQSGVREGELV